MIYPETKSEALTDVLAGCSFADPYRWLEGESAEVRQWQRAQAQIAENFVRDWPHFEAVKQLVRKYNTERRIGLPRFAAGLWFRSHVAQGASQAQAVVSREPFGEGRILFDPIKESAEKPPYLSWISPSPDGRTLAIGICTDGSERNTIRLIDVESGETLSNPPSHPLMDNWMGGAHWLPDSSGFFFTAIDGKSIDFVQQVLLHRRTPVAETVVLDIPWTQNKEWRMVTVSAEGRYATALERLRNPIPVAVADLRQSPLTWRPFITKTAHAVAGHVIGERYIAVTDLDAPRGRVVAIDLDSQDPNDSRQWQELVPEEAATLRTVIPVNGALYLTELVDTYARVRVVDELGRPLGEVPLPGAGALCELPFTIMNLAPRGSPDQFLFAFSSLTQSWGVYSFNLSEGRTTVLQQPSVQLEGAVVEDRWAVSRDGTRIPYQVLRRADTDATAPLPTLIYAYGGFKVPELVQFPGPMAAMVAARGAYVLAHIRGGGELGQAWWEGGRMGQKQNGYDDLYAVAEDLIAAGRCTPQSLALTGGSNGGLMAGVAATQRPELWKAVIPRVPMLDLIGACREGYGRLAISMEYADVDDPTEVRRLASFSPYHLLREGVQYPGIFIDAGDTDPRCPCWHARKFIARLQSVSRPGGNPALVHIWENVGHGWATDKNVALIEHTEWLAFAMKLLGVELSPE